MNTRRRIVRWAIAAPAAFAIVLLLWAVLDAFEGASARTIWNHTWQSSTGRLLGGYLITPEQARRLQPGPVTGTRITVAASGDDRLPAVLLIHEWWGLNREMVHMAEQLALDGYVVLAPDAYRGGLAVSVPGALLQNLVRSRRRITADLDTAYDVLQSLPGVDPDRIAVVGFCFGGTQAMLLGARSREARAIGIYYGSDPIVDRDAIGHLSGGRLLLGIYGGSDNLIPLDDVLTFERLLHESGARAAIEVVPDYGHAFVNPRALAEDPIAASTWDRMRRFLSTGL